jgi:pimeloyl-ACP methyl ester carboxylesterase
VVAVDMPGFGLTGRPGALPDYDAVRMLQELVPALGLPGPLLLLGHSLGGLVAAKYSLAQRAAVSAAKAEPAAAAAPAGLVLLAPLLIPQPPGAAAARAGGAAAALRDAAALAAALASATLRYALSLVVLLVSPLLAQLLRTFVYSRAFWVNGIGSAYHDPAKLSPETLDGYRRAARVRGWDRGFVAFARFRATGGMSLWQLLAKGWRSARDPKGLPEALAEGGAPTLLLHGDGDRIIPASNSRALAAALPHAELEAVPACGHCPQEEAPDAVVAAIVRFARQHGLAR